MVTCSTSYLMWQIQPDLEELEANMDDIEDSDSSKDEVQLGRLHFSMDYDFTKSEVFCGISL